MRDRVENRSGDTASGAALRGGLLAREAAASGTLDTSSTRSLVPIADLTAGEAALLRAIAAAPGATSTGWAAELGVLDYLAEVER